MEIKYNINPRLSIFLLSGLIMMCASYIIFVYQPIHLIINKIVTFGPNTLFTKLWSKPPHSVLISVYVFNVTNQEGFLAGKEKLKVIQIGPYVYQEKLVNQNASFSDNGTMKFYPRRYLSFRRDLSISDPDTDYIITPNLPLVGMQASMQDASMFTNLGLTTVSNIVNAQPFLNITLSNYLLGYDDKMVTLANQFFPNWINFKRFGIMDRLMALDNATNEVVLNMDPEAAPPSSQLSDEEKSAKYHIHRWNGSPGLKHWGYEDDPKSEKNTRCNMVEGSFEGTVTPRDPQPNTTIKVYRRAFCRPIPFKYNGEAMAGGMKGVEYRLDELFLAGPERNPDEACYCVKNKCLRPGLGSMAPCYYDIPIVISRPHFLDSDPWLLEQVEGMKPNKTAHDASFIVHPNLGVALSANLRIQINLDVGTTRYNSRTKPFNNLVLPLFWLELSLGDIPPILTFLITLSYSIMPVVEIVLTYLLGIGGFLMMSGSTVYYMFLSKEEPNTRLSFRGNYRPIPIIPTNSPYFTPDIRIFK